MKAEEIKEGNILIAKFMGAEIRDTKHYPIKLNDDEYYPEGLKYHSSWDWLMPVVERINTIDVLSKHFKSRHGDGHEDLLHLIYNSLSSADIESCHRRVIIFISILPASKTIGE